jgi:hypothetical protein
MKSKKHISIFLSFFLLVSNLGLAFNVHYCGDQISSVTVETIKTVKQVEKSCCGIVIEKKDSCCKNKIVSTQKKVDLSIIKTFSLETNTAFILPHHNLIIPSKKLTFKKESSATYFCDANAPPFFKLYKQYIFYA